METELLETAYCLLDKCHDIVDKKMCHHIVDFVL